MDVGNILVLLTVLLLIGVAASVIQVVYLWVGAVATQRLFERPPRHIATAGHIAPSVLACMAAVPLFDYVVLRYAITSGSTALPLALCLVGGLGIVLAWVLHAIPGHSRNRKYVLFVLSSTSFGFLAWAVRPPTPLALTISVASGLFFLFAAMVAVFALRPDAPIMAGDRSSNRALRTWRLLSAIQGPDLVSMLLWLTLSIVQLSPLYLFMRWCAKERASRHAVLYLRSFHYDDAARVFAQIVTPAINRSVPVTGLVQASQPPERLLERVPVLWRANFAVVADAQWQGWVDENLSRALAVVIDVSMNTSSVAWELERAKQVLPPERVLLLHRPDAAAPDVGVPTAVYDLDTPESTARARRAVSEWMSTALASFDPRLAAPALIANARRQLPVSVLLVLMLALLVSSLFALAALGVAPR